MEAEYIAASEATKEAVWLKNFLIDLEVVPTMQSTITLYCANSGAVINANEPRSHKRGKHIERKYHLLREIVKGLDTEDLLSTCRRNGSQMHSFVAWSLIGRLLEL